MKKNILIYILCIIGLSSCENWLDVQPKTKIKSDVLLTTEDGYLDALAGVYTLMKSDELYGRLLSFGFTDAVIQSYSAYNNTEYNPVMNWRYEDATVKNKVKNMMTKAYNTIANCNNILGQIDKYESVFRADNYRLVKGEVLAIRAYMHFDMLRLFASTDLTKPAIPYATVLTSDIVPMYTGEQVIDMLTTDLTAAKVLLENDPIKTMVGGGNPSDGLSEFETKRQQRFNYYATVATLARVSAWGGNHTAAAEYAQEVVDVQTRLFPWIESNNISGSDPNRDYTFSTEHLFSLNVHNLDIISKRWFIAPNKSDALYADSYSFPKNVYNDKYGSLTDFRLQYVCKLADAGDPFNGGYQFMKYYQPEKYNQNFSQRIPLIRVSEMYYILAECYMRDGNIGRSIEMLETVRMKRGISKSIPANITAADLAVEVQQEYRKEFQCEGQIFYYYKRNNYVRFPNHWKDTPAEVYTLAFPDDEIEFGGRESDDNQ